MGNLFCCIGMSREEADEKKAQGKCLCCVQLPDPGLRRNVYYKSQCCDCRSWWKTCCWNVGG